MKFLSAEQKEELLDYMLTQHRSSAGVNYRVSAAWAFQRFGIEVSAYECFDLLADSIVEVE